MDLEEQCPLPSQQSVTRQTNLYRENVIEVQPGYD